MKPRLNVLVGLTLLVAAVALTIYAAAPDDRMFVATNDTITLDSQWTGDNWEVINSVICSTSDSGILNITVTGTAVLDPWDKVRLSLSHLNADSMTRPLTDTEYYCGGHEHGQMRLPFIFRHFLYESAATKDTIYLLGACGGSSSMERVFLEDVMFQVTVDNTSSDSS